MSEWRKILFWLAWNIGPESWLGDFLIGIAVQSIQDEVHTIKAETK